MLQIVFNKTETLIIWWLHGPLFSGCMDLCSVLLLQFHNRRPNKWRKKRPQPPNHRPPSTPPLSPAATIFCFFDRLKLKSNKVRFVLSTLQPFKPMMKDGGFSYNNCNDWLSCKQLTNHKKSHRKCLVVVTTTTKQQQQKRLHQLLKNAPHSHFLWTDWHASLQKSIKIYLAGFPQCHSLKATLSI